MLACRDSSNPYYVVDKIRIPAAQVYSQTSQTGQGCVANLFDSNTWCQQFPIRPSGTTNAAASGKIKLRFLALAPPGNTVTLTLTSLKIFDLNLTNGSAGDGTRGVTANTPATAIPLTDFSFNLNTSLSTTVQTTPMQIQTIVYDFTPPSLSALLTYATNNNFFPGFILSYSATSPGQSYVDNGFLTFYILPNSTDTASWTTINTSLSSVVSSSVLAQALALSSTNVPIQVSSVSPTSSSAIAANSDNNISAQLIYNPSAYSFSPIQWYVSSGSVSNDRAISTTWNPQQTGASTSIIVARDLLGGVDYKISSYTAQ